MPRASRGAVLAVVALGAWLVPATVVAQAPPRDRHVDVSGGLVWIGPMPVAKVSAVEMAAGGQARTVFQSETTRDGPPGLVARVSVRIARVVQAELAVTHNPSEVSTRLTQDSEAAAGRARESVTRDVVEGGVMVGRDHDPGGHLAPFVTAGVGYARLLHEGRTFVETGQTYYVGGGTEYRLGSRAAGPVRETGLRFDARAVLIREWAGGRQIAHVVPVLGVSLFVGF